MPFTAAAFGGRPSEPSKKNILGYVDNVRRDGDQISINGWACAIGDKNPIQVSLFIGNKKIETKTTNIKSESRVNRRCETKGIFTTYRYKFTYHYTELTDLQFHNIQVRGHSAPGKTVKLLKSGRYQVPFAEVIPPYNVPDPSNKIARDCSNIETQAILKGTKQLINCNLTLQNGDVISNRITLKGDKSTNVTVNCNGATLNKGVGIFSEKVNGRWIRPEGIKFNRCIFRGGVGIRAIAGNSLEMKRESRKPGYVRYTQAAAPRDILFDRCVFVARNNISLYLFPGVGYVTVKNSKFIGKTKSVAIYLSAETYRNKFLDNIVKTDTTNIKHHKVAGITVYKEDLSRELIAVDGSSFNLFQGNHLSRLNHGGIFLYRNCGETGAIRHNTPSFNTIRKNTFVYIKYSGSKKGVHIASRNGNRNYCGADKGYLVGSSSNNFDLAMFNKVIGNKFLNRLMIRVSEKNNIIKKNYVVRPR